MVSKMILPQSENGFILTMNHYVYMLEKPDQYSQAFIDYAISIRGRALDIGAAYGVSTIPALRGGAYVIANDLDERHLTILKERASSSFLNNLILMPGKFSRDISIRNNSLDAVLASGVLHYLEGDELEDAFVKIFKILKPGGKFFFFPSTPYIKLFRKFLPIYKTRKLRGLKWPGLIKDVWIYAPERQGNLPKTINLLDMETLLNLLNQTGFEIEKSSYVEMIGYPPDIHSDGREYIGTIAIKP
jgi:SAM-dependent methyltransferase